MADLGDHLRDEFELDPSRIAEEITRVTSFDAVDSVQRLLQVLRRERMVRVATLWKIKRRSHSLCAKGRTTNIFNPDPLDPKNEHAFVCPYDDSILRTIIESDAFKNGQPHIIDDINQYRSDPFFDPALSTGNVGLKKVIILPVKSFKRKDFNPSYILLIYIEIGFENKAINHWLLQAIANKAGSTLSTQIEIRLNEITEFMKETVLEAQDFGLFLAKFASEIIPKYIWYRHSVLLWQSPNSTRYELTFNSKYDQILSHEMIEAISQVCISMEQKTTIFFQACALAKAAPIFAGAKSIIVAPIHSNSFADKPHGFLILIDKLSPLAKQVNEGSQIVDFFDWEDELIVNHAVSLVALVAELMNAESRRTQLANQISHEMIMPANFIISTTQQILESAQFPVSIRRGLNEMLTYASLQMALCDGILMALQDEGAPPSRRYRPEIVDLAELAKEVARLTYPFCRQHRAKPENIFVSRSLPRLFVDRSAFTQIFLNLITNAIKYRGLDAKPEQFRVHIDVDDMRQSELKKDVLLRHPNRTIFFDWKELERSSEGGYLISVEDSGMGIPEGCEEKIFGRHFRAPGAEEVAARGSGLGLAIVRRIVADHGGVIWLENRAHPTRFAIYLPRRLARRDYVKEPAWRGEK